MKMNMSRTKFKKYHLVYQTTNLINNKIYVGKHSTDNINDGYLGSGNNIKIDIKKYDKENFKREILFNCRTIEEAYILESVIVDQDFINREDTYNIVVGGICGMDSTGLKRSEECCQKHRNYRHSEESLNKLKARKPSEETKNKIKSSNSTSKNKALFRELKKNRIVTEETKLKMKKPKTELHKQNMKKPKPSAAIEKQIKTRSKQFSKLLIISPHNEKFIIQYNLAEFCRKNNLAYHTMIMHINKGKIKKSKSSNSSIHINTVGWEIQLFELVNEENNNYKIKKIKIKIRKSPKFLLISPANEIFIIQNTLLSFCNKYNMSYSALFLNKDKGIITKRNSSNAIKYLNIIGWELKRIPDEIKDSKIYENVWSL